MVELALTVPLLALILVGATDLGRAFFYYNRLTNAVEAGALVGRFAPQNAKAPVTNADCTNSAYMDYVDCRVVLEGKGALTLQTSDVTVECYNSTLTTKKASCSGSDVGIGDMLVVQATYQFRPLTTQLAGILGSSIRMSKTIRMVITG